MLHTVIFQPLIQIYISVVIADLKDSADEKKISLLEIQFWKALLSGLIVEQHLYCKSFCLLVAICVVLLYI